MDKVLEVCKNLKHTIDSMGDKDVTTGNSSLHGNNPWDGIKPAKKMLQNKLNKLMKKNNITDEQLTT